MPVSIHAPVRGATPHRSRGGKDCIVSIHAPVRGATRLFGFFNRALYVSIHAPVRGATIRSLCGSLSGKLSFNPRSRARSDFQFALYKCPNKFSFNPRSRARSDSWCRLLLNNIGAAFQSTLPCEERLVQQAMEARKAMFQSTLPCEERRRDI